MKDLDREPARTSVKGLSSLVDILTSDRFWPKLLRFILVPIGVGVVAFTIIKSLTEPHWVAPGWSYFNNYAKNVEAAAFSGALAAAIAASLLAHITTLYLVLLPVGLYGLMSALLSIEVPLSAMIPTGLFIFLVAALFIGLWEKEAYSARHEEGKAPWWAHVLCLLVVAPAAFLLNLNFLPWIDTYHSGGLLYSSVNIFRGEVPFETFYLFHGLHDSGIGALWIGLTNKIGSSTLLLTYATNVALSAVGFYLLCFMTVRSARVALGATLFVIAVEYVFGIRQTDSIESNLTAVSILGPPGSFQTWVTVIVGLLVLNSNARLRHFFAGSIAGFSHLWRLETGLYGFLALAGVLVYSDLFSPAQTGRRWVERARSLLIHGVLFATGAALLFGLSYLILGWPSSNWWQVVFGEYARYYSDLEGVPFPTIPSPDPMVRARFTSIAFGQLLLITVLVITSIRVVVRAVRHGTRSAPDALEARSPRNGDVLLFLALIGAFSSKTMFSRSDVGHIFQTSPVIVSGVVLLLVASAARALGCGRIQTFCVLAVALFMVNPRTNEVRLSMPSASWKSPLISIQALKEHLSPNPPIGECRDQTFTPSEAFNPEVQEFINVTCDVERLFVESGVRNFISLQAASWYYVRFGTVTLPWKYNHLFRAVAPGQQLELIERLRRSDPGALIRTANFRARESIDGVPSSIIMPVIEAYLQELLQGVKPIETGIGLIYLLDNPGYRLPPPPSDPFRPLPPRLAAEAGFHLVVDELLYTPAGFLVGLGWGIEWKGTWEGSLPLKRLFLYSGGSLVGEVSYGSDRLDVALSLNNPHPMVGWKFELVVPTHERSWSDLGMRALTLDGRIIDAQIDTSSMRNLPRLRGREWDDLPEAVAEARRIAKETRISEQSER